MEIERPRIARKRVALLGLGVLLAVFLALGQWQVERRAWKHALIARVEAHLAADPVAAPGPAAWPRIGEADAYRRLRVSGRFRHDLETCTQAVTVRGPGCWVMTPLHTQQGWWLLVNRGFVDPSQRDPSTRTQGQVEGTIELTGLLRLSEPKGGFLRDNDPRVGRWTSRDVAVIAAARGLPPGDVAPYFVDAAESVAGGPVAGLTVLRFRDSHLAYALTWFGLAALTAFGAVLVLRRTG